MTRIVRLTEADLAKLVRRVIKEQQNFEVSIEGQQPYPNTDWDMVHGYFGSKRTADDLEDRVSKALANGNYRVDNVSISTTKEGASIKTKGIVSLRQAGPNELPHKYFTTRGSIGNVGGDKSDPNYYVNRHDTQVNGLDGRLKSYYKSNGVEVFGPYEILIKGTPYGYKQSFFAIEGQPSNKTANSAQTPQNAAASGGGQRSQVQGKSFPDLRNIVKILFEDGDSIDPNSFKLDTNTFKLQYSQGDTRVKSVSLIYDDRGQLDARLPQILQKNPTMKVATKGKAGNIEWAILYFE